MLDWDRVQSIAMRVGGLLKARHETVAITESSCGGLVSAALLSVPGASTYYKGADCAYTRESQARYFPPELMDQVKRGEVKYGAEEFMLRRARFVRSALGADWGISETGQTGPTFLRVKAKGPFEQDGAGEGGIRRLAEGEGRARAVVAVSGGPVGGGERAERVATDFKDRERNMEEFACRCLLLLESALLAKGCTGGGHGVAKL